MSKKRIRFITFSLFLFLCMYLNSIAESDSYEPNNSRETAFQISFTNRTWSSEGADIETSIDQDWYKFNGNEGKIVTIICEETSDLDSKIVLYKDDTIIAAVDYSYGGNYEMIENFPLISSGIYYIGVGYYKSISKISNVETENAGTYDLTVTITDSGAITGKVTDSETGTELSSANITVAPGNNLSTTTDSNGSYTIFNIPPGDLYTVTASKFGYYPSSQSNVAVTPNGTTTVNISLSPFSETDIERKVLLEEFTGTWCGYCPYGAEIIEEIKDNYDYVIALAYHDDDEMRTNEGDKLISVLGPAYPQAAIDRTQFSGYDGIPISRGSWEEKCIERTEYPPTFSISLECDYDPSTRTVDLAVTLCTTRDLSGTYRFNVIVSEDSLNYKQKVYQQDVEEYDPYYHMNVVREIITGAFGEVLNDSPLSSDICLQKNYSFTLNSNYNEELCHIVVFVHQDLVDGIGPVQQTEEIDIISEELVYIEDSQEPKAYSLSQNYPNPFNLLTTIQYEIPERNFVIIKIYNTLGQEVKSLINKHLLPGKYSVMWDGKDNDGKEVTSGLYFYQLKAEAMSKIKKLMLIK